MGDSGLGNGIVRGVAIENWSFGRYPFRMNATPTLDVPLEILDSARMTMEEMRLELAIALFNLDRLSMGKAAEFACLPVGTFQSHLASRQIGPHYGIDEAIEDARVLSALTP